MQLEQLNITKKYSPAHITSIFLRYRNNPNIALEHLDDVDNTFEQVVESNTKIDCDGDMNIPSTYKKI
jgi:hypothetical protein